MIRLGVLWRMYCVARKACDPWNALQIAVGFESLTRKYPEVCERIVAEYCGVDA